MAKKTSAPCRLLVFDTETTGLPKPRRVALSKQPRIIEFAAALYDAGTKELLREWSTLINPQQEIEPIITKITGITQAQLDAPGVPLYADVAQQIEAFFREANVSIAHNHYFDKSLVEFELWRTVGADAAQAFPWPAPVCTVEYFKPLWGRRPKLTEVYAHFMGEPLAQTHRALDDIHALARVALQEGVWQ